MHMTRSGFIRVLITSVGAVVVGEGCGDSSSTGGTGGAGGTGTTSSSTGTGSSSTGAGAMCGATGTAIVPTHGHALDIPMADLSSTTDKTYDIKGTSPHTHSVTLTAAQLGQLKAGMTVMGLMSTAGGVDNHTHTITAKC
jgi:hypothetical protein